MNASAIFPTGTRIVTLAAIALLGTGPRAPSAFATEPSTAPNLAQIQWPDATPLPPLEPENCTSVLESGSVDAADFPLSRWKITYQTRNTTGEEVTASGLLVIPARVKYPTTFLAYQHGTAVDRNDVPSRGEGASVLASCSFATLGIPMVAADYVGLGDGVGFHPYLHKQTEAWATIDLLKHLQSAVPGRKEILIAGYSQGGHATLAVQQAMEKNQRHSPFHVLASVPMAGPYDLSGATVRGAIDTPQPHDSAIYAAYVLSAYEQIYGGLWHDPIEVFKPEFIDLPRQFSLQEQRVLSLVPLLPQDLLQQDFLNDVRNNPQNRLRRLLAINSVHDWRPQAPVHFVYSPADLVVVPENTFVAMENMRARGASVTVARMPEGSTHATGFVPSLREARRYFAETLAR